MTLKDNVPEYTISQISQEIKLKLETGFEYVKIRGEISGFRGLHASGHGYFALKDETARIDAVVWKWAFKKLSFRPEEGIEVVATGKISSYPNSSRYQIIIDDLHPAGIGSLMVMMEERKKRFQEEGLFDHDRKKVCPLIPSVIGIITSLSGAAIHDMLNRLSERLSCRVIIWPVAMQGVNCPKEVTDAIRGFNNAEYQSIKEDYSEERKLLPLPRPDVIIVARGGGSLEDLWGFNDEGVVRAAAESDIPIISGVGHETDFTLIDYVVDVRAPTPTAAAEIVIPSKNALTDRINNLTNIASQRVISDVKNRKITLGSICNKLPKVGNFFSNHRQCIEHLSNSAFISLNRKLNSTKFNFYAIKSRLHPSLVKGRVVNYLNTITNANNMCSQFLRYHFDVSRQNLSRLSSDHLSKLVTDNISLKKDRLADMDKSLKHAWGVFIRNKSLKLDNLDNVLCAVSHQSVLKRGFAVLKDKKSGAILTSSKDLNYQKEIVIDMHDGSVEALVASSFSENGKQSRSGNYRSQQVKMNGKAVSVSTSRKKRSSVNKPSLEDLDPRQKNLF